MTKFKDWPRWLQFAHAALGFVLVYVLWPKTTKQWIWFAVLGGYYMIIYFVFMR